MFAALSGVALVSAPALARNTITTAAGCSQEFKGSKAQIKTCRECVDADGRFRLSAARKSWSCDAGSSSGSSGASGSGGLRPSRPVGSDKPARPAQKPVPKKSPASPPPASPGKHFKDYVTIKAGTFTIGSPESDPDRDSNEHRASITLTRDFLMKTTEVTQGEWLFIQRTATEYHDEDCGYDCPVGGMSWKGALEYLNALSKKEGLEACYVFDGEQVEWPKGLDCAGYRLPTEAEWEYAARGGSEAPRYGEAAEIAWFFDNSANTLHPARTKKANAYGLYDVYGGVQEWTWDSADDASFQEGATDPFTGTGSQPTERGERIIRGGSYRDSIRVMRAPWRRGYNASFTSAELGFRPVRTVVK
ncbi:hypothetical protein A176_000792 [Myxococcus hansupus]|uniref:Sulfatase-modifying factor enzyme-like domain-containing protein n=1 Tax=Pseudomyxococcus hansupus TaxID=1297742 RepID=A0A0H4WR93_9BACT|nr:hypothetical protein A176_000792 [Myxococcus hansupus]